jgi:2-polyprenyl-3-methyl-5-hydroxy-6-metoxy-1,4-benzoquinol methylase
MKKENNPMAKEEGYHSPLEESGRPHMRTPDDAEAYASALNSNYGFETEVVRARFNYLLRQIAQLQPVRILEIGCGLELFINAAIQSGVDFERWVVVEPAPILAEQARMRAATETRLHVVEGYCEDLVVGQAAGKLGPFDTVLVSGVLHEVEDPIDLLRNALALAAPGARVLVTTPNALSFHRLLAVEMGLMSTPHVLSSRNLRFRQNRVFDPESLRRLLEQGGLHDLQFEGYLFKPFTHAQMEQVFERWPVNATEGLDRLGQKFPHYAAEIAYIGIKD